MPTSKAEGENITYDKFPDVCPICHHAIAPKFLQATLSTHRDKIGVLMDAAFKCTRHTCARMFIGRYDRPATQANKATGSFKLRASVPLEFEKPSVYPEIVELSQGFYDVYCQAAAAEKYQLDQISGVGYRKALEFLIKDYCIHKNPNKKDSIQSKFLGSCIKEFIDDQNIKVCAERAAWLGNDETHYIRKWDDKDISDLKILIELTIGWIRNNVLTEKYLKEMNGS